MENLLFLGVPILKHIRVKLESEQQNECDGSEFKPVKHSIYHTHRQSPHLCGNFLPSLIIMSALKGYCIGNNWYCFILKNVENRKKKFQRIKKL